MRSRDSAVGIATGRGFGVRVLVGKINFSSSCSPDRLWGPPNLLSNAYRVQRPGREANHSSPTLTEVNKTWIHYPMRVHSVVLTFLLHEVRGELHLPTSLTLGTEPTAVIRQNAEWTPESVWTLWSGEKSLPLIPFVFSVVERVACDYTGWTRAPGWIFMALLYCVIIYSWHND
jgi:hypothetical protein